MAKEAMAVGLRGRSNVDRHDNQRVTNNGVEVGT